MSHKTSNDLFNSPSGAPNVRFISPRVQAAAAAAEYSKTAAEFFNMSVKLLLLAQNVGVTQAADKQLQEHLSQTQGLCDRLCLFFNTATATHSGANLFRYLRYLLEKVEQNPSIDTFYEIASVAEVLAEGINPARVCSV